MMKSMLKAIAKPIYMNLLSQLSVPLRTKLKNSSELKFWKEFYTGMPTEEERNKQRAHYEYFFTTFFGLSKDAYAKKSILDVGCGPLGSLEWADNSARRVGLDPLADRYRDLSGDRHSMEYVKAPSEAIPFEDETFDFVTALNSLDHVDDVAATTNEMKRVLKKGGKILIIAEVFHEPSMNEPHRLDDKLALEHFPELDVFFSELCGVRADHDLYRSLRERTEFIEGKEGILCLGLAKLDA